MKYRMFNSFTFLIKIDVCLRFDSILVNESMIFEIANDYFKTCRNNNLESRISRLY